MRQRYRETERTRRQRKKERSKRATEQRETDTSKEREKESDRDTDGKTKAEKNEKALRGKRYILEVQCSLSAQFKLLPAANHMQAAVRKQTDWLLHPCCLAIRNALEQDKKRRYTRDLHFSVFVTKTSSSPPPRITECDKTQTRCAVWTVPACVVHSLKPSVPACVEIDPDLAASVERTTNHFPVLPAKTSDSARALSAFDLACVQLLEARICGAKESPNSNSIDFEK